MPPRTSLGGSYLYVYNHSSIHDVFINLLTGIRFCNKKIYRNTKLKTMLNYFKPVLVKVSSNPIVFRRELRKAFKYLKDAERTQLRDWLRNESLI
jgi:hypothetical protein